LNIKAGEKELQHLMTLMDADHSGDIDYDEFKKVMADSFFKRYSRQELLGAFKKRKNLMILYHVWEDI
jgi:Ca2+-binding EF-hand superfamily protein